MKIGRQMAEIWTKKRMLIAQKSYAQNKNISEKKFHPIRSFFGHGGRHGNRKQKYF